MVCGFVRFHSYSLSRVYTVQVRSDFLLTTFPTMLVKIFNKNFLSKLIPENYSSKFFSILEIKNSENFRSIRAENSIDFNRLNSTLIMSDYSLSFTINHLRMELLMVNSWPREYESLKGWSGED